MAAAALVIYLVWAALAFGWRAIVQRRRTGDTGFRGFSGTPGSIEWWAGLLFVVAIVAGLAAPVLDLVDVVEPLDLLDLDGVAAAGIALAVAGVVGTLAAQLAMGDSWRVGVDPDERTALVVDGPFALARNPIFSMMVLTAAGLTLMVPNIVAVGGFVGLIVGLELQVRLVEEPYLSTAHGQSYTTYATQVGRFLPGIGRLPANRAAEDAQRLENR